MLGLHKLDAILRLLGLRSTEEIGHEVGQEALEQEFYDLPDSRERARMSPQKLAILLSQQAAGTPAYILVEHELDLRIASVQSKATVRAGWLGLIGALCGATLGFFLGTLPKAEKNLSEKVLHCECVSQVLQSKPQTPSSTMPSNISGDGTPTETKSQKEKTAGNTKQ